jgi:hypothetical protein
LFLQRVVTQPDHQALTPTLMVVNFSRRMAWISELSCMERHVKMEFIPGYCCILLSASESPDKVLTCTNMFLSFTRATSWHAILCRCQSKPARSCMTTHSRHVIHLLFNDRSKLTYENKVQGRSVMQVIDLYNFRDVNGPCEPLR